MTRDTFAAREWTRAALAGSLALVFCFASVAFFRTAELDRAQNALSAIYQKAFYETCELTEGISVSLNKLAVSGGSMREALLGDVIRLAQGAQANLSVLPLGDGNALPALKYVNQVGDFCETLLGRGELSADDRETIARLSKTAAELTVGFNSLLARYEDGTLKLTGNLSGDDALGAISDPAVRYPTLLYDGPFSDGADGTRFKALEGLKQMSAEEAAAHLAKFLGQEGGISLDAERSLPVPCYEFSVRAGGRELSAVVTKAGGQVLNLLCLSEVREARLTEAECFARAEAFLLERGYGSMELSYYSRHEGILTANYAARQNGVILYPDLVKLQISMEDGAIVGLEAGNYLRNHVERALPQPVLTAEEAAARLDPALAAENVRLCVIPEDSGEAFCYEISASGGGSTFLIYLDAVTGSEVEILQVTGDSEETLVM